jgi:hypothetical protein
MTATLPMLRDSVIARQALRKYAMKRSAALPRVRTQGVAALPKYISSQIVSLAFRRSSERAPVNRGERGFSDDSAGWLAAR